jgi:hypothetical protein
LQKALEKQESTLGEARKVGGPTLAVALNAVVMTRIGNAMYKKKVDADTLVKEAEEAHKAAPSEGTRTLLAAALAFRAHQALIRESRPYANLASATERSLTASLIYHLADHNGPLRDQVLANPDVKRAMAIRIEQWKNNPADRGPMTWALIHTAYPKEGEQMADAIRMDAAGALERSIDRTLAPLSAVQALEVYWALRIAGKNAEADQVLKKAAADGIPLPPINK